MSGEGANSDSLTIVLWGAMIVVLLILIALNFYAKRLGKQSRVRFWDVKRIRGRYESKELNWIALFLSLVVAPIGSAIAALALLRLIEGDEQTSDVLLPIGVLIASPRELFMVLADMLATRAPMAV